MHFSLALLASSAIAVSSLALPADNTRRSTPVLHEKRTAHHNRAWKRTTRVAPDSIVPVRIGLTQTNLDRGHDELMRVADPASPYYGQHLTQEAVHDLFAPSEETVNEVRQWLAAAGIDPDVIVHSDNKGWLALDIPAGDVERLFSSELHEYEHIQTSHTRLGCEEYHLPAHLLDHIDFITPGAKLSAPVKKRSLAPRNPSRTNGAPARPGRPGWKPVPSHHWPLPPAASALPLDLQACDVNITPTCVRALYQLPQNTVADPANAPGFFEQGDYYAQQDLNLFFENFAPYVPQGTAPKPQFIDGAEAPVAPSSVNNGGESDIDLDIGFALNYPTIPVLYQVDDQHYAIEELDSYDLFNTFLDALDGSYCTYTAYGITGDSWRDAKYPDPAAGGYKGKLQCGVYTPTRVISISYGQAEHDEPLRYNKRQCSEWMKLGLQGVTVLEASGDYGVASFPGDDSTSGCLSGDGQNQTIYNPDQLSSCPYVTSVGATALYAGQTIYDKESAMQVNLGAGAELFASHGGFSNVFPRASYQEAAVAEYLEYHNPGYKTYVANADVTNLGEGGGIYNRAGRAFPDVSANGAYMLAFNNETLEHWFGTSLASPIFASVISHVNTERSAAGKSAVGFINPTLYAHPWAFNDIVNGSNPNCGSGGFHAVPGWDPVTGLGTPNYPKLLEVFMSLP